MYHVLELCSVLCSPATCNEATAHSMMSGGCVDLLVQQLRAQTSDDMLITSLECTRALLVWPRACDFFTQAGVIAPLVHTISHHAGTTAAGISVRVLALQVLNVRATPPPPPPTPLPFLPPPPIWRPFCNTLRIFSPATATTCANCAANGAPRTRSCAASHSPSHPPRRFSLQQCSPPPP